MLTVTEDKKKLSKDDSNHILESSFYHLNYDNSRKLWRSEGDWKNSCQRLTLTGLYGRAVKFRRQKKAAKTLGIVVGCFLLCWFPFFIILPLDAACSSCHLSGTIFNLTFWLGYFNSCLNPFIYVCSSRELRRAFRHILCRPGKSSIRKKRALHCR